MSRWTMLSPRPVPCRGPLVVKYGWKIFGSTSGGMPGPVSLTREHHQRRGVVQALDVQQPVLRAVLECRQVQRRVQHFAADFDAVRQRRALKGVDREVQQNLDHVRAVDFDGDVLGQRRDAEFIVLQARMDADELFEVAEQLIHAHAAGVVQSDWRRRKPR